MNHPTRVLYLVLCFVLSSASFAKTTTGRVECIVSRTDLTKPDAMPSEVTLKFDVAALAKDMDSVIQDPGPLEGRTLDLMVYVTDGDRRELTLQLDQKMQDSTSILLAATRMPTVGDFSLSYRSLDSTTLMTIGCFAHGNNK